MGGSVGLCIGFIFGGYNILKHGAGPNGFLRSLGGYMAGSAATFGYVYSGAGRRWGVREIWGIKANMGYSFFMSIGTAIRTEEMVAGDNKVMLEWARRRKAVQVLAAQE